MTNDIKKFLNFSLPSMLSLRYGWIYLAGVFVYVLITLKNHLPFYHQESIVSNTGWIVVGFGLICIGLYELFYAIFPRIFKKYFQSKNWTMGKELLHLLFFFLAAMLVNGAYSLLTIPVISDRLTYLMCVLHISFSSNLLPVFALTFFNHTLYVLRKEQVAKENIKDPLALEASQVLDQLLLLTDEKELLTAVASTEKIDFIRINQKMYSKNDICFFKVNGNYTYIFYSSGNVMCKDSIHLSLIKIVDLLAEFPQFVKCHNSYVVNVDKILKCKGNKRDMTLIIKEYNTILLVSRGLADSIKNQVNKKS